jgi:hypothetical protein
MKYLTYPLIAIIVLALPACGPDNKQSKLFEDQRSALDKAKTVDSTIQQQAQQLQQSADKQSE